MPAKSSLVDPDTRSGILLLYGFYANVNPEVDHPRWSQKTERVIGGGFFSAVTYWFEDDAVFASCGT